MYLHRLRKHVCSHIRLQEVGNELKLEAGVHRRPLQLQLGACGSWQWPALLWLTRLGLRRAVEEGVDVEDNGLAVPVKVGAKYL